MQRFLLSPNFYLDEFCRSQTAERFGKKIIVGLESSIAQNLQHLCVTVLQPLRDALGVPITVTSGYRPKWLNDHIGGSQTSHHLFGLAVDIVVPGVSPAEVAFKVAELHLPFEQVILEYDSWTHISVPAIGDLPARQLLTISQGATGRCVQAGIRTK